MLSKSLIKKVLWQCMECNKDFESDPDWEFSFCSSECSGIWYDKQ